MWGTRQLVAGLEFESWTAHREASVEMCELSELSELRGGVTPWSDPLSLSQGTSWFCGAGRSGSLLRKGLWYRGTEDVAKDSRGSRETGLGQVELGRRHLLFIFSGYSSRGKPR
jgi:hypothetical protein